MKNNFREKKILLWTAVWKEMRTLSISIRKNANISQFFFSLFVLSKRAIIMALNWFNSISLCFIIDIFRTETLHTYASRVWVDAECMVYLSKLCAMLEKTLLHFSWLNYIKSMMLRLRLNDRTTFFLLSSSVFAFNFSRSLTAWNWVPRGNRMRHFNKIFLS